MFAQKFTFRGYYHQTSAQDVRNIPVRETKDCSSMDPQDLWFHVTSVPLEISKTDLTII